MTVADEKERLETSASENEGTTGITTHILLLIYFPSFITTIITPTPGSVC
mgnify:CR=1 FL=1